MTFYLQLAGVAYDTNSIFTFTKECGGSVLITWHGQKRQNLCVRTDIYTFIQQIWVCRYGLGYFFSVKISHWLYQAV